MNKPAIEGGTPVRENKIYYKCCIYDLAKMSFILSYDREENKGTYNRNNIAYKKSWASVITFILSKL